jgi:choline dehydrogenase
LFIFSIFNLFFMPTSKHVDYIIVGAGTAGCVIARRILDQTNATVLLLEAGDGDPSSDVVIDPNKWFMTFGTDIDYRYSYAPQPFLNNRVIQAPRGKILGGSSSINGLIWARGSRSDYDGWAAQGNLGWDYESVLPLFKRIEDWEEGESDYHGAGGPVHIEKVKAPNYLATALIDAAVSFGLPLMEDMSGPDPFGAGVLVRNVKDGKRSSAYTGYLQPVGHHPNLTLLTGAVVIQLILGDTTCKGVQYIQGGQTYEAYADSEVILCAGTFDSPRILMLSGIGEADELAAAGIRSVHLLKGVGKNLQDHANCAIMPVLKPEFDTAGLDLQISMVFAKSRHAGAASNLMFFDPPFPLITAEVAGKYWVPRNAFSIISALMLPETRGYVKMLSSSPAGPLEIQPNMLTQGSDLTTMVEGIRMALAFTDQPAMKDMIQQVVGLSSQSTDVEIVEYLRLGMATYFHPTGTCKMGSDENSVVDERLSVHGIERLRVADASIMPQITSGNTHAPTLMIGEFLAAKLVGDGRQTNLAKSTSHALTI